MSTKIRQEFTSNLQAQILGTNSDEGKIKDEIKAERDERIKKNDGSSWQHQMKKQKE